MRENIPTCESNSVG